jgi:two-component system cell cycle sensor histidine kinase/response regulator CckA
LNSFNIAYPATRNEFVASPFTDAGRQREPGNIMLVEDEALVRMATAEVLHSAGYRTILASNAAEALEVCQGSDSQIDLLLTDVVMPGMNGRDLASHFKKIYPRTRVLLMTGYVEQLSPHQPAENENLALSKMCLAKPFSSRSLLNKVREVLEANPSELNPYVANHSDLNPNELNQNDAPAPA